ncbi:MAG: hypothetical protein O3A82_15360 [Verrucomicrobia bacterium]|nr:hypothetical protein [Verrucomicrobiota bacterium]
MTEEKLGQEKTTAWGKMFRAADTEWTLEEEADAMDELRKAVEEGEKSREDKTRQDLEKEFEKYFGDIGARTDMG